METGIFIRVGSKNMDVGNPNMEIDKLLDWVLSLNIEGQLRLIMTLLGRRKEFEEWKQNESLKQEK